MGVSSINKLIVPILLIILLSSGVLAAVAADTSTGMQTINDNIAKGNAQVIKAVKDGQNATITQAIGEIDANFGVYDKSMQQYFKDSKRDLAIILFCSLVAGSALAAIIRVRIEGGARRKVVKRIYEVEEKLASLEDQAKKLTVVVGSLQQMEEKYSAELKELKGEDLFKINWKIILFSFGTFCLGMVVVCGLIFFKVITFG